MVHDLHAWTLCILVLQEYSVVPTAQMSVWMMPPVCTLMVASLVHVHLVSVEMAEQVLMGVDVQVHTRKEILMLMHALVFRLD